MKLMSDNGVDDAELENAEKIYDSAVSFIINTGFTPPCDDPDKY